MSLYATFAVSSFNKFIMAGLLYEVGSSAYTMLRTLLFNLNGFFWEPTTTFGIYESVERVIIERGIIVTLFCVFVIRMISMYVVFNLMVSQILDYLKTSRVKGEQRQKLNEDKERRIAEAEVKKMLKMKQEKE